MFWCVPLVLVVVFILVVLALVDSFQKSVVSGFFWDVAKFAKIFEAHFICWGNFICAGNPGTCQQGGTAAVGAQKVRSHPLKLISVSLQFCTKISNLLILPTFWLDKPRCASWGITSYDLDPTSGRIIFPAGGSLFFCADPATGHTGELPCDHYILFQNQSHVLVVL